MTDPELEEIKGDLRKNHELILEVEDRLNRLNSHEQPPGKVIPAVFESKLVTTLLTVIVGVLGGRYLAEHIQAGAREQEQRHMETMQQMQDLQKVYDDAFAAVARATTASQNILNLIAEHSYIVPNDPNAEKDAWTSYRAATNEWLSQRQRLGLMLAARSGDPKQVQVEWDGLCKSVDNFDDCAFRHNQSYAAKPGYVGRIEVRGFCATEKSDLGRKLVDLSQLLHQKARQVAREE